MNGSESVGYKTRVDLAKYTLWYLAGVIVVFVIAVALAVVGGIEFPSGASAIIPPMLAAMLEGGRIARNTRTRMQSRAAWVEATRMTGMVLVINLIFAGIAFAVPSVRGILMSVPAGVLFILALILFAAILVVNRTFLAIGIKNELKAIEKRENKAK